jgi:integrase
LMVRKHIVPTLGRKRLDRLAPADLRWLLAAKADSGLSTSTVKSIHVVLGSALQHALREDLVSRNVARLVQVPTPEAKPVEPLDVEDARKLLDAARDHRLYALWSVAIGVGLRRGEVAGLRWEDVDLEAGTLRVEQTLQRVGGELRFDVPKTTRSRRAIPLPAVCVDVLREHRVRQNKERLALGPVWTDSGLVFTTTIGTPLEPRNLVRSLHALCRKAEVRQIRPHDLRHTCASFLLAQGWPLGS